MGGLENWGSLFRNSDQPLGPREREFTQLELGLGTVQKPRPKIDLRLDPADNASNLLKWFGETDDKNLQLHDKFHQLVIRENVEGLVIFLNSHRSQLEKIHQQLPELVEQAITKIRERKAWQRHFLGL